MYKTSGKDTKTGLTKRRYKIRFADFAHARQGSNKFGFVPAQPQNSKSQKNKSQNQEFLYEVSVHQSGDHLEIFYYFCTVKQ